MSLSKEFVMDFIYNSIFSIHYSADSRGHSGPVNFCENDYCKTGREVLKTVGEVFEKAWMYDEVSK